VLPARRQPSPAPTEVASAVAEFIGIGSAPLPDRQSLAEQIEAGPAARDVDELLCRGRESISTPAGGEAQNRLAEAWARVLTIGSAPITTADAAVALQSLTDISTRDGIASLLIPNNLDLETLPEDTQALVRRITSVHAVDHDEDPTTGAMKARLIDLCQHATDEHAAPILTVLATYSWWHGDGALARVAIDRALRCDPSYRLARLLSLMLDEGIRPEPS
jgi:hypothetical protein